MDNTSYQYLKSQLKVAMDQILPMLRLEPAQSDKMKSLLIQKFFEAVGKLTKLELELTKIRQTASSTSVDQN